MRILEYALAYSLLHYKRTVTVTSLHTGQVKQTVLFHKSLCKLVTGVMVIAEEVVVLQHRLVSDMLIDMLPKIKPQPSLSKIVEMARAELTVSKVSLSGITRESVILRTEATIKASRVMLCINKTIECKTGVNNHEDPIEYCR